VSGRPGTGQTSCSTGSPFIATAPRKGLHLRDAEHRRSKGPSPDRTVVNWVWGNLMTPGILGMADEESQTYDFTVTYHLSG
jgi:hypothetical protein